MIDQSIFSWVIILFTLMATYMDIAEMPTSGDLKSGDCLFFTPPPEFQWPPEKLTQPPMGMT